MDFNQIFSTLAWAISTKKIRRGIQLTGRNMITDESTGPVQLKYCDDENWVGLIISLGFIDDVLH